MPQYTDNVLKKFPFSQVVRQTELDEDLESERHMFDFRCSKDSDNDDDQSMFVWEDPEEIDRILLQTLGSTLDDLH